MRHRSKRKTEIMLILTPSTGPQREPVSKNSTQRETFLIKWVVLMFGIAKLNAQDMLRRVMADWQDMTEHHVEPLF